MERVELTRECEAVQIPAGIATTLEKGIEVFITQSLGGTYTLQVPAHGGLFRIAGKDADAHKATAVAILGVEQAKQKLFGLVAEAEATLAPFGPRAAVLKAAARFVAERRA